MVSLGFSKTSIDGFWCAFVVEALMVLLVLMFFLCEDYLENLDVVVSQRSQP